LGEQTLHYYLKVFSFTLIIFFIYFFGYIYNIFNKQILLINKFFEIEKGERIENVLKSNVSNLTNFDIYFIKKYFQIYRIFNNKFIHYGEFFIEKNVSPTEFLNIISKPSNILNKITIIEGWSQKDLDNELSKNFTNFYSIPYEDIIADTYFYEKKTDFNSFVKKLRNIRNSYFDKFINNELSDIYTSNQIMIIGSLIEKEGLDIQDKKKISSVIMNRLNNNMKLQIDATVLYAITDGKYNLDRKLLLSDLKFDDPYNTYKYKGLPPKPISYVGRQTIDIIFENNNTDFLFYFFNNSLNRHIFSNNYEDHRKKLYEFRNNQ